MKNYEAKRSPATTITAMNAHPFHTVRDEVMHRVGVRVTHTVRTDALHETTILTIMLWKVAHVVV